MKAYFNFSRNEKIGVITLSGLILALTIVLNVGSSNYLPDPYDVDQSKLEFLVLDDEKNPKTNASYESNNEVSNPIIADFNPNEIGKEEWMSFGFSEKQTASILNYRNNFGPFKTKKDIQKIYVVSDEMYERLEPHIVFSEEITNNDITEEAIVEIPKIELNKATSAELEAIKWIGPTFAKRIIDLRVKIGGFIEFDQLKELRLLDETLESLQENTIISPQYIARKNVNTITKDELKQLPYSNWLVITEILKQRDKGRIENLEFLTDEMISNSDKAKLLNYISF